MPAYGVYEEKMCGLNGSSGGTGKFWILHTVFENQSKKSRFTTSHILFEFSRQKSTSLTV